MKKLSKKVAIYMGVGIFLMSAFPVVKLWRVESHVGDIANKINSKYPVSTADYAFYKSIADSVSQTPQRKQTLAMNQSRGQQGLNEPATIAQNRSGDLQAFQNPDVAPTVSRSFRTTTTTQINNAVVQPNAGLASKTIASNNAGTMYSNADLSTKQAIQKVGGKPAEPGLGSPSGSLPVGDGKSILLLFAGLFAIRKFRKTVS